MKLNTSDVNECTGGNHAYHVNALCDNTEGSHRCWCKDGYKGDGFLGEGEYLVCFLQLECKLISSLII